MHFTYCPHCGNKLILKDIGDEGLIPYCTTCQIPLWDMFTTSIICAVCNEENEVALIKQGYVSTNYICVAGIMKLNESAEECAIREIKEEIGLDVISLKYIASYPFMKKEMLMLGFKAVVKKADFMLSAEVDSVRWFSYDEVLQNMKEGSIAYQLVEASIK